MPLNSHTLENVPASFGRQQSVAPVATSSTGLSSSVAGSREEDIASGRCRVGNRVRALMLWPIDVSKDGRDPSQPCTTDRLAIYATPPPIYATSPPC